MSAKTLGETYWSTYTGSLPHGRRIFSRKFGALDPDTRTALEAAAQAVAARAARDVTEERDRYRDALRRLADPDTPVLDEGLGGGPTEELHVRTSLAKQALGEKVECCTACMVSLGLDPDDDSARDALDAQTLHDSPGSDL